MEDIIKTRKDLRFFIQEDAKRNGCNKGFLRYCASLFVGNENAQAFRYLKLLRHCEYHSNNEGIYHKVLAFYYHFRKNRLGLKYSIQIHINTCGYGLRIMHLSGGGHFVEC